MLYEVITIPKRHRAHAREVKGGTERILLVEDEISIGEVGSDMLRELGYTIRNNFV